MGWVGSHFQAHVMGWVGLSEKYCYFVYCVLCLLQYYVLRKFANKCDGWVGLGPYVDGLGWVG